MRLSIPFVLSSLLLLMPATAMAAAEVGKPAPAFKAKAVDGAEVSSEALKGKIVVLEWNNPGCPFVKKHYDGNNMQKLQGYAHNKGVIWLTVNSSAAGKQGNMTTEQAKELIASKKISSAHYILDADGTIGNLYGAKSTPHMFVIDKKGDIAYMGAIDDHADTDQASIKDSKNYVKLAIDNLLGGKPIETASTQAYGCSVKYAD